MTHTQRRVIVVENNQKIPLRIQKKYSEPCELKTVKI